MFLVLCPTYNKATHKMSHSRWGLRNLVPLLVLVFFSAFCCLFCFSLVSPHLLEFRPLLCAAEPEPQRSRAKGTIPWHHTICFWYSAVIHSSRQSVVRFSAPPVPSHRNGRLGESGRGTGTYNTIYFNTSSV